ncbi:MAG: AlpA family phage regulatory protein [Planctomycetota bacterium]|jgi:predicted DNA-binding transcriptional regulator AlpA|nr:AlpA family phage regulatory protein [Planctomycetota bacterium]
MAKEEISAVLPVEGFVKLPVVLKVLGIGKTSWWNGIREGKYPRAAMLGTRTARWHVEEIRALIAKYRAEAGNESTEDATDGK